MNEINRWAANYWLWDTDKRFTTLREAKAYLNEAFGRKSLSQLLKEQGVVSYSDTKPCYLKTLLTKYEGYDTIRHYDKEGNLDSIVRIIPDDSYLGYHFGKPVKKV